jgi:methionyl-tRNA synthetase
MPRTVVTSALPYAIGPIHIGHLGYIQTDIPSVHKICGDHVIISVDDTRHADHDSVKAGIRRSS